MIVFSPEATFPRPDIEITGVVHRADRSQDGQFSTVFDYSPGAGIVGGGRDSVNMNF